MVIPKPLNLLLVFILKISSHSVLSLVVISWPLTILEYGSDDDVRRIPPIPINIAYCLVHCYMPNKY